MIVLPSYLLAHSSPRYFLNFYFFQLFIPHQYILLTFVPLIFSRIHFPLPVSFPLLHHPVSSSLFVLCCFASPPPSSTISYLCFLTYTLSSLPLVHFILPFSHTLVPPSSHTPCPPFLSYTSPSIRSMAQ